MKIQGEAKLEESSDRDPNLVDASGWSRNMDQLLLQRRNGGLAWKAIGIVGPDGVRMTTKRCQDRYKLLTAEGGRVEPKVAAKAGAEPADRDGLDWLERKGRLTPRRKAAGLHYREVFRDAGELSIRSCLDDTVGGGSGGMQVQHLAAGHASAKRELFELRWVVLGGQSELLTVCDGVLGTRHTLRGLAGGGSSDQVKERARVLEAVLMVGLDLIAGHQERKADAKQA